MTTLYAITEDSDEGGYQVHAVFDNEAAAQATIERLELKWCEIRSWPVHTGRIDPVRDGWIARSRSDGTTYVRRELVAPWDWQAERSEALPPIAVTYASDGFPAVTTFAATEAEAERMASAVFESELLDAGLEHRPVTSSAFGMSAVSAVMEAIYKPIMDDLLNDLNRTLWAPQDND